MQSNSTVLNKTKAYNRHYTEPLILITFGISSLSFFRFLWKLFVRDRRRNRKVRRHRRCTANVSRCGHGRSRSSRQGSQGILAHAHIVAARLYHRSTLVLPVLVFPFLLRERLSPLVPVALQLLDPSILLLFFLRQSLFKLQSLFLVLLQSLLMLRFALDLAALKIVHAIVKYLFSALQILLKVLVESAKFLCFIIITVHLASGNIASRACRSCGRIHSWRNLRGSR